MPALDEGLARLDECGDREDAGAKARTLARVRAAGLPALDGAVLPAGAPVEDGELGAALARLGGEAFAVRSSSSVEDRAGASAAGVFESVIGARGLDGVKAAIARVRASALGEAAGAYLAARGIAAGARMAVLIQPVARAERLAVARSLDGGGFLVEERRAGEPEWGDVAASTVQAGDPLATLLRRIEELVGGPADVELARAGDDVTVLQARPRAAQPAARAAEAFHVDGNWRLDAEHNPEPLSAAQAGLVAFVDGLGAGPRQRLVGGYLYFERGGARGGSPIPIAQLRRRFADEVAPECEARLAPVEERGELEPALDAFAHVYRRYVGEVGPSLSRAREQLDQLLRANLGEPLAAHGDLLAGLGGVTVEKDQALWELGRAPRDSAARGPLWTAYAARFGAYAPAWDVAVPTDGETPERVLAAAERLSGARPPVERHAEAVRAAEEAGRALLERLDRMARGAFKSLWPLAREVLPIAEDDDLLFFRAQRAVRRALLAAGERLHAAGRLDDASDVFALPLDVVRAQSAVVDLRAAAAAGRAALVAAGRVAPPIAIDGGQPRYAALPSGDVLRGHATAGRARGRAFVLRSLSAAPAALPPDAVLVVPAILPSLGYLLPGARALVTDHGGATSHGATLAREYGLPAVLGAAGATGLPDGADLFVDGAAGRVYRLG